MQWDTRCYDQQHGFVAKLGESLAQQLAAQSGERILDVGCGTGHLTNKIAASGAHVIGLDSSPEMIEQAREHYPALSFVLSDICQFSTNQPFDAIFSNAALHWIAEPDRAVHRMSVALKTGGRFVVEFGGKGNVQKILSCLEAAYQRVTGQTVSATNYFPSISQYGSILEKHGIELLSAELFDRLTPLEGGEDGLIQWLKMFRRPIVECLTQSQRQELFDLVQTRLRDQLFDGRQWHADYRRLRIFGKKQ